MSEPEFTPAAEDEMSCVHCNDGWCNHPEGNECEHFFDVMGGGGGCEMDLT